MASTLAFALLAMLQLVASQAIPYCLQNCLTSTKIELCSPHALPQLTNCISNECLNPPAAQNLIANLGVSFSPKLEYSCQQSVLPGTHENSFSLPLNQSCATSPYEFKSFVPSASSAINAANGCRVLIYSDEECLGESSSVDIGTVDGGRCIFHGGRSARLTCNNELDAARAYMESTCNENSPFDLIPSSREPAYGWPTSYDSGSGVGTSSPAHSSATDASPVTNSAYTSAPASRTTHYMPLPTSSAIVNAAIPAYGNGTSTSTLTYGTETPIGTSTDSNGGVWITLSMTPTPTALPTYTGAAARLGAPLVMAAAALAFV